MPSVPFITRLLLILATVGSLLLGCMSGISSTTRFYVLDSLDFDADLVDEIAGEPPLSVEISSLRLPQYLERPHIVTRRSGNRLDLSEFHQWGGNLRKNTIRVIAKNLSGLLATPNIAMAPYHPPVPPDFRIQLEIMQFERDTDGRVKLSAQWRLIWGKNLKSLAAEITELSSSVAYTGSNYERIVSSMSALLGELSEIIGREILERAYGSSPPGD